jgi:hypothetical protein
VRALTGYPLWFGLIAAGLKPDENRERRIVRHADYGVPFALHNGAPQRRKQHAETWRRIQQIAPDLIEGWRVDEESTWPPWYRLSKITGAVIAVTTIVCRAEIRAGWLYDADTGDKLLPAAERRFAFGPVIYMLGAVRPLAIPVHCPGKLGFWALPDEAERSVAAQLSSGECP